MNIYPGVYLITDRKLISGEDIIGVVKEALGAGIRTVQLREKDMGTNDLFQLASRMREITNMFNARLIINDRVDVALCAGADGVHLGNAGIPVKAVRKITPDGFLVGVSTHGKDEALRAFEHGADFITCGPVYETPSKMKYGPPIGIRELEEVVSLVDIPVYALGGIKKENIPEVMNTGVYGISMISAILTSQNIEKTVKEIVRLTE